MNIHNRLVRHSPQGDGGRTTQKSAFADRNAENNFREAARNPNLKNVPLLLGLLRTSLKPNSN